MHAKVISDLTFARPQLSIKSLLADIDRQLAHAPLGITHIGMEAERDAVTADLRRERNLQTVREFGFESRVVEVHLHYYLPRSSEAASWMIDETVDSQCAILSRILDDARLLASQPSDFDSEDSAWHLPPPPVPRV